MGCAGPNHLADSASFEKDSALSCLVVCPLPSSINLSHDTTKKITIDNKQTDKNYMLIEDYIMCFSLSLVNEQLLFVDLVNKRGFALCVLLVPGCSDLSLAA